MSSPPTGLTQRWETTGNNGGEEASSEKKRTTRSRSRALCCFTANKKAVQTCRHVSPSLTHRGQFHLKNAGVNHSIRSLSFFHIHEYSAFFSGYILDCSYNKGNVIKREHLKGKSCAQERKKKHQFRTVHCDTSRLGS